MSMGLLPLGRLQKKRNSGFKKGLEKKKVIQFMDEQELLKGRCRENSCGIYRLPFNICEVKKILSSKHSA